MRARPSATALLVRQHPTQLSAILRLQNQSIDGSGLRKVRLSICEKFGQAAAIVELNLLVAIVRRLTFHGGTALRGNDDICLLTSTRKKCKIYRTQMELAEETRAF